MTKQCVQSDTKYYDQRLLRMSIRSDAFSFILSSTGLVVEHANVLKCGPLQRPAFPRWPQKFLWTPGSLPKQSDLNYGKSWIRLSEPAGKHWEKLQRCLNFARQELALCGTCNYQPCAQQEGITARMKWVPNACFKLYAFKALMKILWTWMSWQKFRLSTHEFGCWWNRAPPSANEANHLPESTSK